MFPNSYGHTKIDQAQQQLEAYKCTHGTQVAGIAAGADYANGPGFSGVAPGASIIAIQVGHYDQQEHTIATSPGELGSALSEVYKMSGDYQIAAVNISLGDDAGLNLFPEPCTDPSVPLGNSAVRAVVDALRGEKRIATIISAGNGGGNGTGFPACLDNVIAIGATDDTVSPETLWQNSDRAPWTNLLAPGVGIRSSIPRSALMPQNFSFPFDADHDGIVDVDQGTDGTSNAAPHVAGAWALIKSARPNATLDTVFNALKSTGHPFPPGYRIQVDTAISSIP